MNWQQVISLALVGLSAVLLVRGAIQRRRRARSRQCGGDCGCADSLVLTKHVRKLHLKQGKKLL